MPRLHAPMKFIRLNILLKERLGDLWTEGYF
jgi:hypothetical protein